MVTDFAALAGRIAADPGFGPAAAALCRQVQDFCASRPPAMRLLGDRGQMRGMVACRYLDPDSTLAAVQKVVPAHVASPNRVAAALPLMKCDRAPLACDGRDRRTRRYCLSDDGLALADAFLTMMAAAGAPFADTPVDPSRSCACAEDFLLATMERGGGIKSGPETERGQTLKGGALLNLELMRRGLEPGDTSGFSRRAFCRPLRPVARAGDRVPGNSGPCRLGNPVGWAVAAHVAGDGGRAARQHRRGSGGQRSDLRSPTGRARPPRRRSAQQAPGTG